MHRNKAISKARKPNNISDHVCNKKVFQMSIFFNKDFFILLQQSVKKRYLQFYVQSCDTKFCLRQLFWSFQKYMVLCKF